MLRPAVRRRICGSSVIEQAREAAREIPTMVAFTINGKQASADAAPDTPLLWAIREHLKLTGTKFGCGAGLCGACTVHVDGKAVRSCQTAVSEVEGKTVMTIEGLSPDSSHPLQKAWVAEQVPQCGYCQSGHFVMSLPTTSPLNVRSTPDTMFLPAA